MLSLSWTLEATLSLGVTMILILHGLVLALIKHWLLPLRLSCFLLLLLSMFLQLVKTTLLFLFFLTLVLRQCTRKPFSFEMAWLSDPSCEALIVEVWTSVNVMGSPLYRVCERL